MTPSDRGATMSRQTRQDPGWGLGLLPSEVTLILCIRSCVYMHVCICMCVYACVYMHVCVPTPVVLPGESHGQ